MAHLSYQPQFRSVSEHDRSTHWSRPWIGQVCFSGLEARCLGLCHAAVLMILNPVESGSGMVVLKNRIGLQHRR